MQLRESLEGITILDETGESTALSDLWRDKPLVLALVRHFG